ncbi:hypothetical protein ABT093_16455 [Kitasatospora sp. NPDC002551]|uniref:hypothetical protein n=1 Tax=unclassified Kitasatospora TaxID=2633591 RepID=UPI00332E18CD
MSRSPTVRLRVSAVALVASACLLGGAAGAQAAPAGAEAARSGPSRAVAATEMATFTAAGTGGSMGSAIESAANVAYSYAQRAGWQRSQCYLRASEVRSTGSGWFSAVAEVFCQR